jgi:hypothetical protein
MKNKKYVIYGFKKFLSYLVIGTLTATIPFSYVGIIFGSISILSASIIFSILDAVKLKSVESGSESFHNVLTKRYLFVVVALAIVSFAAHRLIMS